MLIDTLFNDVRLPLRDNNANLHPDPLMVPLYNRAIVEVWSIMNQIGGEIAMSSGTIATDGSARDYLLPTDFRAFVPHGVRPRDPRTATADYGYRYHLKQVGLHDPGMIGGPTVAKSPQRFALYVSDDNQYLRFDTLPPSGEYYDYRYYPTPQRIAVGDVATTSTPWLGLLDTLLARILEQFCREGLEFITAKRDIWRAQTESDVIMLLGLRHLDEVEQTPSMWQGMP